MSPHPGVGERDAARTQRAALADLHSPSQLHASEQRATGSDPAVLLHQDLQLQPTASADAGRTGEHATGADEHVAQQSHAFADDGLRRDDIE